jgi:hypothetical protein
MRLSPRTLPQSITIQTKPEGCAMGVPAAEHQGSSDGELAQNGVNVVNQMKARHSSYLPSGNRQTAVQSRYGL